MRPGQDRSQRNTLGWLGWGVGGAIASWVVYIFDGEARVEWTIDIYSFVVAKKFLGETSYKEPTIINTNPTLEFTVEDLQAG